MKSFLVIFLLTIVNYCFASNLSHLNLKSDFLKDLLIQGIRNINISGSENRGYNQSVCVLQLRSLAANDENVFKIFDSWGKIPSGIAWGHIISLGNYDECVRTTVHVDNENSFRGQYCQAGVPIDFESSPIAKLKRLGTLPSRRAAGPGMQTSSLAIGICIPDSCDPDIVAVLLNSAVSQLNESSSFVNGKISILPKSCSSGNPFKYEAVDYVALVIFGFFAAVLLFSSIYDFIARRRCVHPKPILVAFSVLSSSKKLFQISTHKSPNSVDCLNGIRVFSMVWVIYGHTHLWMLGVPLMNAIDILSWFHSPYSMLVQTATVAVDSFFFLSGFLIAWLGCKELQKRNGKLNVLLMYFHRFLRLTPVLGIAILFVVSLQKFMGSGPYWAKFVQVTKSSCATNWWATLLYVQNYATPTKMCLVHSWYLAVDTQLYILSPLILIPLWKWGKKFAPVMVILSLLSIGCVIGTFYNRGFSKVLDMGGDRFKLVYFTTHTRYSPWLVGIGLGYYLFINKDRRIRVSKLNVLLGWIAALAVIFAVIFGPFQSTQPGYKSTVFEAAMYESLSRVSWSIALAWIVFACHNGYGGPVNSILSFPFWQPFGRLTYCMYIFHIMTQGTQFGNYRTDMHFSNYEVILQFWAAFGMTILIAVIFVLAFESPIIAIERIIFNNGNEKRNLKAASGENLVRSESDLAQQKNVA